MICDCTSTGRAGSGRGIHTREPGRSTGDRDPITGGRGVERPIRGVLSLRQCRGRLPGPALPGGITCTAPARAEEEREARVGWGRLWDFLPSLRPTRSLTTTCPAPGREPWGRGGMVLLDGEGVPSPAPPRVISPRSGAWNDAGKEYNRSCFPGPALPGDITCTAPAHGGGGGARSAGGVGGREERGVLMRCRQNAQSGFSPRLRPSRALATTCPAPGREPCGRAGMVLLAGEGVPSPAPPRVISPRSGA